MIFFFIISHPQCLSLDFVNIFVNINFDNTVFNLLKSTVFFHFLKNIELGQLTFQMDTGVFYDIQFVLLS